MDPIDPMDPMDLKYSNRIKEKIKGRSIGSEVFKEIKKRVVNSGSTDPWIQ